MAWSHEMPVVGLTWADTQAAAEAAAVAAAAGPDEPPAEVWRPGGDPWPLIAMIVPTEAAAITTAIAATPAGAFNRPGRDGRAGGAEGTCGGGAAGGGAAAGGAAPGGGLNPASVHGVPAADPSSVGALADAAAAWAAAGGG